MRILELDSRCAVIRTVGSNPTLSANSLAATRPDCGAMQTRRKRSSSGYGPYSESEGAGLSAYCRVDLVGNGQRPRKNRIQIPRFWIDIAL
jgi:hypothetical protein